MNQKIEDLKLLIKNDRRLWAGAGFVVAVLIIFSFTNESGTRKVRIAPPPKASELGSGPTEAYGDLIVAFKNDIEEGKNDRQKMAAELTRTTADFKEHKERVTGIFETLVDKFESLARDVDALAASMRNQADVVPLPSTPEQEGPDELEPIGFEEPTVARAPEEPAPTRVSVIAPGDNVTVSLMTGVNAPVDGTPYPVVFKLTGPIGGPDGSSLDLGEARLIAAAQGSESDSRAIFRLTQLSVRHPSGRRAVIEVDGWVVGEDGIRGMQGKLIDKLGRLIAMTAIVSGASALGESLVDNSDNSDNSSTTNANGTLTLQSDDASYAAASALSDASNRLGEVLLNRYESLVPVVEVLSGRDVSAIFSKPAEIAVIEDAVYASGGNYGGIE